MATGLSLLQLTNYTERRLIATDTTPRYEWLTGWFLATGVDTIRAAITINASSGSNFKAALVIQPAKNRTDAAGTPAVLTSYITASASTQDQTVTTQLLQEQWFRVGIAYYSQSGTNQADVGLQVSWVQRGALAGASSLVLSSGAAAARIEPITAWFPQVFVDKVRLAYELSSLVGAGTITPTLVAQTAPYTTALPGSFTTQSLATLQTAAGEYNTGDLTFSTGNDDMWVRLGLSYTLSSTQSNVIFRGIASIRTT